MTTTEAIEILHHLAATNPDVVQAERARLMTAARAAGVTWVRIAAVGGWATGTGARNWWLRHRDDAPLNDWAEVHRLDGRTEWECRHGVGHSADIHGCDGCCQSDPSYPG